MQETLKAAVHWERPGCAFAQSSPNLTLAAMGLRVDSARPQRVSGSARTDSRRAESARNPIASHVNFGDDSALNAFTRTQWRATLKAAVHWVRVSALSSESSPKLTWDAMGLRADLARWLSVRAEPLTR